MTRTGKTVIPTVAASGAGSHTKGDNPEHDHDNAATDAAIAAAIKTHEDTKHGAVTPPVEPPVEPPIPPADAKPTISSVVASNLTQTGVQIGWQLSEPCTGQVEYGKTTSYGSLSAREVTLLAAHSQILSGLTADTTYHFRIHSIDSAGQEVVSSDASFKTTAAVVTPPIPGPEPGTRPWAAPVTTKTVTVPTTIKADGSLDVAIDLNKFLAAQTDGTIIKFDPNATYKISKGMLFSAKNNLILTGNAQILGTGGGNDEAASPFLLRGCNHIQIDPFRVKGSYTAYPSQQGETAHILSISGWYGGRESTYIEMHGVVGGNIQGDFAYFEGENVGDQRPSHHVWITDCDFDYCGRNGMSPINITDVLIEKNKMNHMAYHGFDCEPNQNIEEIGRVTVQNNAFGEYAARGGLIGFAFSFYTPSTAPGYDLAFLNNTVAGIASNGYNHTPRTLHCQFTGTNKRLRNIRVEGNSTPRSTTENNIAYFKAIDGVTVKGNVTPGVTTFAQFDNCTGVVTS
jgi:hypothetical protein